jgi:WD40 repeat protein
VIAGGNGEVLQLELEYMNELQRFFAHEGGVSSLCFDHQHGQLITGGKDGYLRWWDAHTFQLMKALPAHKGSIYGIEFVHAGFFMSVSRDKTAKVWDAQHRSVVERWENKHALKRQSVNVLWSNQMGQFAFSGDDKIIHYFSKDTEN